MEENPVQRLDRLNIDPWQREGLIELYGRMRKVANRIGGEPEFARIDRVFDILIRRMIQRNRDGEMTRERLKQGWVAQQATEEPSVNDWAGLLGAVMNAVTRAHPGREIFLEPNGKLFRSNREIKKWRDDYQRELGL